MAETLNLVNPDDVLSCNYEISRFPDGQQSLRIIEHNYITFYSLKEQTAPMTIYSRLNTFQDLELIICANQALKEIGVKSVKLYIPYCIGGRSDRKFQVGGINYIKTVIAPIINSQNFDEVMIMDPHSDVLEACINNFTKIYNYPLLEFSFRDYFKVNGYDYSEERFKDICLVSPDAGAFKKIFDVAAAYGIKNVITATKVRDLETGKILHTDVPLDEASLNKDIFIIDDICDGGRTFVEIGKAIKENKKFTGRIYLVVTHGIFTYGFELLSEYFEQIYTTNSVKDIQDGTIVNAFSKHKTIHALVKQRNIF
jgi:ribose-phosphate pyrophosphokinase